MSNRTLTVWSCSLFLAMVVASPALADFFAEEIDTGVYFVSYERGRFTSGSFLDTAQKARRKLERRSHELCLEAGYAYLRIPTLGEISREPELKAVWEIAVGDEPADTALAAGGKNNILFTSSTKIHKSRRILVLSSTGQEGFVACVEK